MLLRWAGSVVYFLLYLSKVWDHFIYLFFKEYYESLFCSPRLNLFDQKCNTSVTLWNIIINLPVFYLNSFLKCTLFLFCKAEFSAAITPVSVFRETFRDHSDCYYLFLIIINVENSYATFFGNHNTVDLHVFQDYFINRQLKRTAFIFCNPNTCTCLYYYFWLI